MTYLKAVLVFITTINEIYQKILLEVKNEKLNKAIATARATGDTSGVDSLLGPR